MGCFQVWYCIILNAGDPTLSFRLILRHFQWFQQEREAKYESSWKDLEQNKTTFTQPLWTEVKFLTTTLCNIHDLEIILSLRNPDTFQASFQYFSG